MPPRLEGTKRAPRKRREPQRPPASIFGPIGRADRPITTAQRTAHRRVTRAQVRLPERPLPTIPTLRRPTQRQAQTAVTLTRRAVRNLTPAQKRELLADPRSRAKLAVALRAQRIQARKGAERHAGALQRPAKPLAAPLTMVDPLVREAVVHPVGLPTGRAGAIALGRRLAAANRSQITPGHHAKLRLPAGAATIDVTNLRRGVMGLTSLNRGDLGPRNLTKRSLADLGLLGAGIPIAGYQIAAGTTEAALGHDPSRLRRLASGVWEGTKEEFRHPGKAFTEHPLLTALDAAGLVTGVGRLAGAATRAASGGAKASRVRPALALSDDPAAVRAGLHVQRTKSGDVTRAAVQDLADARREPLLDADGKPVTVKDRGRDVPVLKTTPMERERLQRRRANQTAALTSSVEKLARETAGKEGKVRGVKGRRAKDLVAMVSEGTILTGKDFRANLISHGRRLEREYQERIKADPKGYRHSEEAQANRDRLATVRAALEDPKVMAQAERIAAVGIEHGRRLTAADRELMARNVLAEGSGYRSRLMHAAVEHMDARHFTVREHRALERAALARERTAAEAVRSATGPAKRQAYAAYQRARRERIAVSGRHPEKVRAHEEARGRVGKAEAQVRAARSEQLQADRALARLGGAQAVQRGSEAAARMQVASRGGRRAQNVLRYIDEVAGDERRLTRGAARERRMEKARADAVRRAARAKDARRKAEKALRQERHRLRENPMPETQAALRKPGGHFLSNREIEDFLRSRGRDPETVGFLPAVAPGKAGVFGQRAHHTQMRVESRPSFDKQRRTGEQYRKGATAATAELLKDQGVRQATQLAKAEQIDKFIGESGARHPAWAKARTGEQLSKAEQRIVNRGGYWSGPEAAEAIERLAADTGEQYVAVTGYGGKLSADTQAAIRDAQDPGAMEGLGQRLFNDRIVAPEELGRTRTRNIVLMPAELKNQMDRHLRPAGEIERAFQVVNRAFRLAVLPQPRWLTGNFVEPYFVRLPMIGSGVVVPGLAMDWAAARKATRLMRESDDPRMVRLAKEIEGQQFGGMLLGRRGASVRRTRDDFKTYGHIVKRLPAIDQFADLAGKAIRVGTLPLEKILQANRPLIEAPTQRASFGRDMRRDIQEISGSYLETIRLGDRAVREALEGLINTPTQERFMRNQHELLGKYEGYGPTMRRLIQTIMPFAPWALSAARFVYWTMPVHHTAKTALLLKTQQVVADEWEKEHADAPPGSLKLAARTKDSGFVDFARYTPYGLTGPIVEGDPQGATDQFLPQITGAVQALSGTDPFGRPLRVAPSPENPRGIPSGGQRAGIAGYTLLEALLPYLSTGRRLREHGETPFAGSTILHPSTKPGTSHGISAARRTFDPLRPTYLRRGGAVAQPAGRARPQPRTRAQRDAEFVRRATHGPSAGAVSSEDLDFVRRAMRGR